MYTFSNGCNREELPQKLPVKTAALFTVFMFYQKLSQRLIRYFLYIHRLIYSCEIHDKFPQRIIRGYFPKHYSILDRQFLRYLTNHITLNSNLSYSKKDCLCRCHHRTTISFSESQKPYRCCSSQGSLSSHPLNLSIGVPAVFFFLYSHVIPRVPAVTIIWQMMQPHWFNLFGAVRRAGCINVSFFSSLAPFGASRSLILGSWSILVYGVATDQEFILYLSA